MLVEWNALQEKHLEEGLHRLVSWSDPERTRNGATGKKRAEGVRHRSIDFIQYHRRKES